MLKIDILLTIRKKRNRMKLNKTLLALSLLVSATAFNLQAFDQGLSGTAIAWIKKNTPLTTGNNLYFENQTSTPFTVDTRNMGGKASYKTQFTLMQNQNKTVPTIGKSEYKGNEHLRLSMGGTKTMDFPLVNSQSGEFYLYHVIKMNGKAPSIFSYDKLGNEIVTPINTTYLHPKN